MKFKFKIQGYQTKAVQNTTAIFTGQPNHDTSKYRRDLGFYANGRQEGTYDNNSYRNADVELSSKQLLENLHSVQNTAGVPLSKSLSKIDGLGVVNLDIEMETGTGTRPLLHPQNFTPQVATAFPLNFANGLSCFNV